MTVVFLINGPQGSSAGVRATRIADALAHVETRLIYRQASRARDLARFGAAAHKADLVYCMDLAVVPTLAALIPSFHAPVVVDTGDAPAAFLDLIGASPPRRAAGRSLEHVGYGSADHIIVRGRYHAEALRLRGYEQVTVVPDGIDVDLFSPIEDLELRRRMGLESCMTVAIQGHFTWYPALGGGLGWELVTALSLRPDLPLRGLLIGDGPGLDELRLLAHRLGVSDRLLILGRIPYKELPRYLGLCDVCLLTQTNDPSSWVRTTGKLPGYLSTGRYVLASRVGTAADVLPDEMLVDYNGHWDTEYPSKLADRFERLLVDPGRPARGLSLRPLGEQFDYRLVAQRAAAVVTSQLVESD